jgi:hypothetical protein
MAGLETWVKRRESAAFLQKKPHIQGSKCELAHSERTQNRDDGWGISTAARGQIDANDGCKQHPLSGDAGRCSSQ